MPGRSPRLLCLMTAGIAARIDRAEWASLPKLAERGCLFWQHSITSCMTAHEWSTSNKGTAHDAIIVLTAHLQRSPWCSRKLSATDIARDGFCTFWGGWNVGHTGTHAPGCASPWCVLRLPAFLGLHGPVGEPEQQTIPDPVSCPCQKSCVSRSVSMRCAARTGCLDAH